MGFGISQDKTNNQQQFDKMDKKLSHVFKDLKILHIAIFFLLMIADSTFSEEKKKDFRIPFNAQGEKSGDPTQNSVILLSRLTAVAKGELEYDVPGMIGKARFEISENEDFTGSTFTDWKEGNSMNDFTIKQKVDGLRSGTQYFYRAIFADIHGEVEKKGTLRKFKTAYSPNITKKRFLCCD